MNASFGEEGRSTAVSRVENHTPGVAHLHYNVRSKEAAAEDFEASQLVRANDILNNAAINDKLLGFKFSLDEEFPSREEVQRLIKKHCIFSCSF